MTTGRLASAAAALSGAFRTAVTSAAAFRSAASSRRATAWVRVRTLSWFASEAGSRVSKMRAASRNEVRAPSSACTRSSSGVHRAVSSAPTGETVTPAMGAGWRQRHIWNRGASTSTVPNKVCSRRVRRSLKGCSTPHAAHTRWWAAYAATCPHSMLACSLANSALVSDNTRPISASVPTPPPDG